MNNSDHNDELHDAVEELRASDCHRLADAVERARAALYGGAPVESSVRAIEPDVFGEDPQTGQLVLSLGEACHA